jgi:hypothetical protein
VPGTALGTAVQEQLPYESGSKMRCAVVRELVAGEQLNKFVVTDRALSVWFLFHDHDISRLRAFA